MKLYHITTIARSNNQPIVEDLLCEEHWNKVKNFSFFKSDHKYEVKVRELNSDRRKCQECESNVK